ncbi:MAG: Carboxylating nicotinate-nucleotide diphosphorylase [Bacteroidetes bacterium]|nr:Carboxylating nicotinate-nucleotide diphosphorylase [Bacteroidota bacterium]
MPSEVLNDSRIGRLVELALMEDIGLGDVTTDAIVPETSLGKGEFVCKETGVVAGLEVAGVVFRYCDQSITLTPAIAEGGVAQVGQVIATVDGDTRGLLRGERTALNFLQRMSGIATLTRLYVDTVEGTNARITDTRKTAPALRLLDKLAVRLGGGVNHRFGLDDMILIKDNHIVAAGGIADAVKRCMSYLREERLDLAIEVETRNLDEVRETLACTGVKRIMLDNFTLTELRNAVALIAHRVEVEASGGITLGTVRSVAETGVDFISIGALTHSAKALDISLELTQTQG